MFLIFFKKMKPKIALKVFLPFNTNRLFLAEKAIVFTLFLRNGAFEALNFLSMFSTFWPLKPYVLICFVLIKIDRRKIEYIPKQK